LKIFKELAVFMKEPAKNWLLKVGSLTQFFGFSEAWVRVTKLFYGIESWSEPAATNALVEDEVVQAVLGMNQKHILPCPKFLVFSTSSLPQSFSLLPTSPHFVLTPSLELERA
jgi:hypothetical protein